MAFHTSRTAAAALAIFEPLRSSDLFAAILSSRIWPVLARRGSSLDSFSIAPVSCNETVGGDYYGRPREHARDHLI